MLLRLVSFDPGSCRRFHCVDQLSLYWWAVHLSLRFSLFVLVDVAFLLNEYGYLLLETFRTLELLDSKIRSEWFWL